MPRVLSARFGRLQLPMRAFVFLLQHYGTRNLILLVAESMGASGIHFPDQLPHFASLAAGIFLTCITGPFMWEHSTSAV